MFRKNNYLLAYKLKISRVMGALGSIRYSTLHKHKHFTSPYYK